MEIVNVKRIQRKRTAGWRMPPNTVSITRPGKFGNPFVVGHWYMDSDISGVTGLQEIWDPHGWSKIENAQQAVDRFRRYVETEGAKSKNNHINNLAMELKGKDLACWCKTGEPCHGDVWIVSRVILRWQKANLYGWLAMQLEQQQRRLMRSVLRVWKLRHLAFR